MGSFVRADFEAYCDYVNSEVAEMKDEIRRECLERLQDLLEMYEAITASAQDPKCAAALLFGNVNRQFRGVMDQLNSIG
jgi:hypothetical protein